MNQKKLELCTRCGAIGTGIKNYVLSIMVVLGGISQALGIMWHLVRKLLELSESFKQSLCSYQNGCVPSSIYNLYCLLDKYYDLFGVFGINHNGEIIFYRSGLCSYRRGWRKPNNMDYFMMRVQIIKMFGSEPSLYNLKEAVALLALGGPYRFNPAKVPATCLHLDS